MLYLFNLKRNTMKSEKIQLYKVVKFFRVSGRRQILVRGLTRDEAKRVVNSYPDSNRSLVGFEKQSPIVNE